MGLKKLVKDAYNEAKGATKTFSNPVAPLFTLPPILKDPAKEITKNTAEELTEGPGTTLLNKGVDLAQGTGNAAKNLYENLGGEKAASELKGEGEKFTDALKVPQLLNETMNNTAAGVAEHEMQKQIKAQEDAKKKAETAIKEQEAFTSEQAREGFKVRQALAGEDTIQRDSTLLTGPLGVPGQAKTKKKTLLGG